MITAIPRGPGGQMGVEKSYDVWLRGSHGIDRVGIDSNARPVERETIQEAQPGYTIKLTIDSELQKVVENKLDEVVRNIERVHPDAQAGAAVVIDVKTGKILAMASRPFMNPNELIGVISEETAQRYFSSEDAASFNRALTGLYPPGSTFKMITAMSALEAGVVSPVDAFADSLSSLGPGQVQSQGIAEWGGITSAGSISTGDWPSPPIFTSRLSEEESLIKSLSLSGKYVMNLV